MEVFGAGRNPTDSAVLNARVVAGLLSEEMILDRTVAGDLMGARDDGAARVGVGREFAYTVRDERPQPHLIRHFDLRLVGRRGN